MVTDDSQPTDQLVKELAAQSRHRDRRVRRALALSDVLGLAVATVVTVPIASDDHLQPVALVLFPAIVGLAKLLGLYEADEQRIGKTTAEEIPRLGQVAMMLILGLWLADTWLIGGPASKQQAIVMGVVFVVVAGLARRASRRLACWGQSRERCLFVGDPVSWTRLLTDFTRHELAADLVGRVSPEDVRPGLGDRSSEPEALREIIARARAHRLIIGPHGLSNAMTFEVIEAARRTGARVSLLPDMLEVVGSSVDFDDLYGMTLLGVRHRQLSRSSRVLKRSFDVVGATLLLIASAPLMAAIALAIRLESPGRVLFRQPRVGRDSEPFMILKFRTMIDGADALKRDLRGRNEAEGLFKILDDPRITRVGGILRRTSLDELPQLINVLRGSMSIVGPRPLVADEDGHILGVRRGRLRLTPGMTGPWQISGSARVPLEDMIKLDHLYVSNWTLWSDIKIILRTVAYVLGRKGM